MVFITDANKNKQLQINEKAVINYGQMPLLKLVEHILDNSDIQALAELHNNRQFFTGNGADIRPLTLVKYVEKLKGSALSKEWCGSDPMVLEQAYDLTVSKFSNFPVENTETQSLKSKGPDCRYYFIAYIDYAINKFETNPPKDSIQAELEAAEMLRKMVARHFYFSCLECKRRARKFVRRYVWKVDESSLTVWMPVEMPGKKKCRTWLESNVPNVDPLQPGERDRVQEVVNQLLPRQVLISLDGLDATGNRISVSPASLSSGIDEEISVNGLAQTVADEKAENIRHQRPSVRALGKKKLRRLILKVFDSLAGGEYEAVDLASSYGISTATLSRFAGTRWTDSSGNGNKMTIPDLWRNTAHILASHRHFARAAQKAGVWKKVCWVLNNE